MTTAAATLPTNGQIAYDRFFGATGGFRDLAKANSYFWSWTMKAFPSLSDTVVGKMATVTTNAKNTHSALVELPKGIIDLKNRVQVYNKAETDSAKAEARNAAILQGLEVAGPFQDTVDLTNKNIASIPSTLMGICSRITFGALFIASMWKSGIEISNISAGRVGTIDVSEDKKPEAVTYALLCLARNVSYAALGAFGFMVVSGVSFAAPWTILAAATSGLVFSLMCHFYQRSHGLDQLKAKTV